MNWHFFCTICFLPFFAFRSLFHCLCLGVSRPRLLTRFFGGVRRGGYRQGTTRRGDHCFFLPESPFPQFFQHLVFFCFCFFAPNKIVTTRNSSVFAKSVIALSIQAPTHITKLDIDLFLKGPQQAWHFMHFPVLVRLQHL